MGRSMLATLVVLTAGSVVVASGRAQTPTDSFSIVLERNGSTWSVECAAGCPFQKASVTVRDPGTPMRLDSEGIRTLKTPHPSAVKFSFTLTPQGNGWAAVAVTGTKWAELSATCESVPCRRVVTDEGVIGAPAQR
jgi:hypothetical protein